MYQIQNPLNYFSDTSGNPLEDGFIYIGSVNLNPQTNPISVYWDEAGMQPAAQPLKTLGGYISRDGAPARVYLNADDYSMSVYDKKQNLVFYAASVTSASTLRNDLSLSSGSSLVGFLQAGTGAISRTVQSKLRDFVSVKDFGAVGDGVTDDTAAMQLAHNTGKVVYYPSGTYLFSSITIASGGIVGDAAAVDVSKPGATVLKSNDVSSADLITYNGNGVNSSYPLFSNFLLVGNSSKTSGCGIRFNPTDNSNNIIGAILSNVNLRYLPICIKFEYSSDWTIANCKLFFYRTYGVYVSNDSTPDVGDSVIEGCHFFNGTGATYGTLGYSIYQKNSGGLKVSGSKFNGGLGSYLLDLTASTSIIIFNGNSFENTSQCALNFNNNANTVGVPVRFTHCVISGNQFGQNNIDISFNTIANYTNVSYWDNIVIEGNTFYYLSAAQNSISLKSARNFIIANNVLNANNVGYRGIFIDVSCPSGKIGRNVFNAFANSSILNNSTGVWIDGDRQSGSVAPVAISAAFATLFAATGTVTFSQPFENTPDISTQVITSGAVVAVTLYNVGPGGFNYQIIAANNSTTAGFNWVATGIKRSY